MRHSRLIPPPLLPHRWRVVMSDVPLAISPLGVSNLPIGSAGRPPELPVERRTWRWEEIVRVGVAKGWIYLNDRPFCPDTGHVSAPQLLALARLAPPERERRIRELMRAWFRPAHLRRRARVLIRGTRIAAAINAVSLIVMAALSAYVLGDLATTLGEARAREVTGFLPWVLLAWLGLHGAAVFVAWRAAGRIRAFGPDKRKAALVSALLLPPQALKLRALVGEPAFPAMHPLAVALAFGDEPTRRENAFNVVADLRWPMASKAESASATEVLGWFRVALESEVRPLLTQAGIPIDGLLAPPKPDGPDSAAYCPRCRAQFADASAGCPHGIALRPILPPRSGKREKTDLAPETL